MKEHEHPYWNTLLGEMGHRNDAEKYAKYIEGASKQKTRIEHEPNAKHGLEHKVYGKRKLTRKESFASQDEYNKYVQAVGKNE